ncbi:MAG: hypothetical protein RLZZ292_2469, partial [Bacteroidota bacterium]
MPCFCNAQFAQDYTPLSNKGVLPTDFTVRASQKFEQDNATLSKNANKKADKTQFYLESNFSIDELLRSGSVLYDNAELTSYVREVAAVLLKDKPETLKKLRFYLLRSPSVNAFATNNGIIFINLGLLAHLKNEAQLAFILAHELTHFEHGHALNLFLENQAIDKAAGKNEVLNQENIEEKIIAKCLFSKELESEADSVGIEKYLKTAYSLESVNGVFDILKGNYFPFENISFDKIFFETPNFKFPKDYFLDTLKTKKIDLDDEDDTRSTHPALKKRRASILAKIKDKSNENRQDFIVSKARFEEVQQVVRLEIPQLYLHQGLYEQAIYHAYILLKKYPENKYLKKIIGQSLYSLAKFRNSETYYRDGSEDSDPNEMEGEGQQVNALFGKLKDKELNRLTMRYLYDLAKKQPTDEDIRLVKDDFFDTWVTNSTIKLEDFPSSPQTEKDSATWSNHILADIVQDTAFTNQLERCQKKKADELEDSAEKTNFYQRYSRNSKRKGAYLGINKILIINPLYQKMDNRKHNKRQYLAGENSQVFLKNLMDKNAKLAKLKTTLLDVLTLKDNEVEKFNDIVQLNDWLSEQTKAKDLLLQGAQQAKINAIAKKYGTEHVLWLGVISLREPKAGVIRQGLATLVYPPFLPVALYNALTPTYDMLFYAVLYNIKTGHYQ